MYALGPFVPWLSVVTLANLSSISGWPTESFAPVAIQSLGLPGGAT